MEFDLNQFERLKDVQLYNHTQALAGKTAIDSETVKAIRKRVGSMDLQHQEMILLVLAKSSSEEAHAYLAEFLSGPHFLLRIIAAKLLAQLPSANEAVMQRAVQALLESDDRSLRAELDGVLHRPMNDKARAIAEKFLSSKPKE